MIYSTYAKIVVVVVVSDPDIALDYSSKPEVDSETLELMRQIWSEQFENVGVRLLSRINSYHTDLEPLEQDPS